MCEFDELGRLIVRCEEDIATYCNESGISIGDFNIPVVIPDDVTSCDNLFRLCESFNQRVTIPDGVISCKKMFYGCFSFNQPVIIPSSVVDCSRMFYSCFSLNSEIKIRCNKDNAERHLEYMFFSCKSFNRPFSIPNNRCNCNFMFALCESFNRKFYITSGVYRCKGMFEGCRSLRKQPSFSYNYSLHFIEGIFQGCERLSPHIYFIDEKGNAYPYIYLYNGIKDNYNKNDWISYYRFIDKRANMEVIKFIADILYHSNDDKLSKDIQYLFSNGYCYYFANMLKDSFGGSVKVVYGVYHIVWCDDNSKGYYDIYGYHEDNSRLVDIDYIKEYLDIYKHNRIVDESMFKIYGELMGTNNINT